jgi:hypothetical protein
LTCDSGELKVGTNYAGGGNNAKSKKNPLDPDYSQPPQNIADAAGMIHDLSFDKLKGGSGCMSPESTPANTQLIKSCRNIVEMYKKRAIDPYSGMPVSKKTLDAAQKMIDGFQSIENTKKLQAEINKNKIKTPIGGY